MKQLADKRRSKRESVKTDWMFLKLQPWLLGRPWSLIQNIMVLSNHSNGGDCDLQDEITIRKFNHLVFNVSLLKKKIEKKVITSSTLLVMD